MKKILRHTVEVERPGHGSGAGGDGAKIGQISLGPEDGQAMIQPVGVSKP